MSDTWNDIQALKSKRQSLREKHSRRKKELEGLLVGITGASASDAASKSSSSASPVPVGFSSKDSSKNLPDDAIKPKVVKLHAQLLAEVEKRLLVILCDLTLNLPVEAPNLTNNVSKVLKEDVPLSSVENLLQKLAAQQHISISYKEDDTDLKSKVLIVTSVDHAKLSAVTDLEGPRDDETSSKRKADQGDSGRPVKAQKLEHPPPEDSVESLLSMHSAKEKENKKLNEEILQLLSAPSAKEQYLAEKFKSQGGAQLQEFCQYGTREECKKVNMTQYACEKLHFRKIINKHTDESLGDCSFLNTCFHMDTCKYVHYEIDYPAGYFSRHRNQATRKQEDKDETTVLFPQQWIQCDLRTFDMSVLGKFSVIMADPPWDIHMELPYGTMSDDEMRRLDVPSLQDDGYIFLWVTGRAMELARECLRLWGYDRIDELIWVKTNQLQRIIRTGRTGHWLNHGKEHCLVGAKGKPKNVNVGLDCDVIVAEVRATSHKPDEIYGIIERLTPGTRKIELFGRPHNVQPNWITLGNQLDGVKLLDPEVVKAYKQRYPDGNCLPK